MTYFEFSNESFNNAYNGMATAKQYASALADWAPQLERIMPNMKLGANGQAGWNSMGSADRTQNTGVQWWPTARPQSDMQLFICASADTKAKRNAFPRHRTIAGRRR